LENAFFSIIRNILTLPEELDKRNPDVSKTLPEYGKGPGWGPLLEVQCADPFVPLTRSIPHNGMSIRNL
jgi:hypothetical protein